MDIKLKVPTIKLNSKHLPRIYLGDRAFLKRYGSRYSFQEALDITCFAAEKSSIGISFSDNFTGKIAKYIKENHGNSLLHHTSNLLKVNNSSSSLRIGSTLSILMSKNENFVLSEKDRINKYFFNSTFNTKPFCDDDLEKISINYQALNSALDLACDIQPDLLTFGGDWLDLCLIANRADIIESISKIFRRELPAKTYLMVFTYLGTVFFTKELKKSINTEYGLMVPINLLGDGMFPSKIEVISWAKKHAINILATHPLALGRIPTLPALDYILNHEQIPFLVCGAGSYEHIQILLESCSTLFMNNSSGC